MSLVKNLDRFLHIESKVVSVESFSNCSVLEPVETFTEMLVMLVLQESSADQRCQQEPVSSFSSKLPTCNF